MATGNTRVRRLTLDDVPRILDIQRAAYASHLLEEADVFATKITSSPLHCVGVVDPSDELVAYVIAFPMEKSASVGLHETVARSGDRETVMPILYIHDLAVHPDAHGTGVGTVILTALESIGRDGGQTVIELVAIESALRFWERRGFRVIDAEVFEGYGAGARKMRRSVDPPGDQAPQRD